MTKIMIIKGIHTCLISVTYLYIIFLYDAESSSLMHWLICMTKSIWISCLPFFVWASVLAWGLTNISVSKLTIVGSRQWLVAWPVPSHYLNQCWTNVDWTLWNKLQWNLNRNSYIFIKENALKMTPGKWWPFCLDLNVLTAIAIGWCRAKHWTEAPLMT